MLAAMDSCFGLFGPHQHGIDNKQAQVPTEDKNFNTNTKFERTLVLM